MLNTAPYRFSFTIPEELRVEKLSFNGGLMVIHASTANPVAECPLCKQPSCRSPATNVTPEQGCGC